MNKAELLAGQLGISRRQYFRRIKAGHAPTVELTKAHLLRDGLFDQLQTAAIALEQSTGDMAKVDTVFAAELAGVAERLRGWWQSELCSLLNCRDRAAKPVTRTPGMSDEAYKKACRDRELERADIKEALGRYLEMEELEKEDQGTPEE